MKNFFLLLLIGIFSNTGSCQIISQFTWDANPPTQADIGPNATSISASATSDINGVGGTNGLNSSLPKQDINMVIPGSPTFDVPGIDISIDFQRDESRGDFFSRGNSLIFGMNGGNLSVVFRVDNGAGGFNTVNSGNIIAIPNDDVFRTYRFIYLPTTGMAYVLVDGVIEWSNTGTPGRNMYWTGSGNVVIGNAMDGNGANKTSFDNLIIASVTASPLPVELSSLTAEKIGKNYSEGVKVEWTTESEVNSDYFILERSSDGLIWEEIQRKNAVGNSNHRTDYTYLDNEAQPGNNFYRLMQFDLDGSMNLYGPVLVDFDKGNEALNLSLYPNPTVDFITLDLDREVKLGKIELVDLLGKTVISPYQINESRKAVIDLSGLPVGKYFLILEVEQERTVAPVQVIR